MFHFRCWPLTRLSCCKVEGRAMRVLSNQRYRLSLSGPEAWKASCALYDLEEGIRRVDQGKTGMHRHPLDLDRCLVVLWEKEMVRVHVEALELDIFVRGLSRFELRVRESWKETGHRGPFYLQVRFCDLAMVAHVLQTDRQDGQDGGW